MTKYILSHFEVHSERIMPVTFITSYNKIFDGVPVTWVLDAAGVSQ